MTRIDNVSYSLYLNNPPSKQEKQELDQLVDQIKAQKQDMLKLDVKQLKKKDLENQNGNQVKKLWTWGCARTKGGVHCPRPDPQPKPNKPKPKPKPNKSL